MNFKTEKPETAQDFVKLFYQFMELLQTAYQEWGSEISTSEQIDVFQYHFIDQWEDYEPDA